MINQLHLDSIGPDRNDLYSKVKPSKLIMIGKPGTGKSFAIKSILYHFRHTINHGIILSATEDTNASYAGIFPDAFIYNSYTETPIKNLIAMQKKAIKARVKNPWTILIIDDCAYDKKFYTTEIQQQLFKNSRHWYILYILAIQYPRDIPPVIRSTIDGIFIFREHNMTTRRIIYENYASVIPSYNLFIKILDKYTCKYGVLYIDNMTSKEEWIDSIAQFRAEDQDDDDYWVFGSEEFQAYADTELL